MKAVFVGGGSLRLLGILRGALKERKVFTGGVIHLHDLDVSRAEAMGRMLMKTPEYRGVNCEITWGSDLERHLGGADMVSVILRAGSMMSYELGADASIKKGFASSDNISPNGAFLALKGGPILMDLARKMERHCPNAILVDFVNPVAVLSGMVNNHTKIKAMGVCAGYTNHMWDLSRILYGLDEQLDVFDVDVAGVNHISYIVKGTAKGKDVFKELDAVLSAGWAPPELGRHLPAKTRRSIIKNSLGGIIRFYKELGVLIFSTEGDGMQHLDYEGAFRRDHKNWKPRSKAEIRAHLKSESKARVKMDMSFRRWLGRETPDKFWSEHWRTGDLVFRREDNDIFVKIMRAIAGAGKYKVAVSSLNRGAVEGFKDRTVLEYSQTIDRGKIVPAGKYSVPDVVYGITSSLATYQTMLGDAIASDNPQLLAHALMAYPIRQYSNASKQLYKELARINLEEIQPGLREVADFL
ncbi:MAG: hypothetical protein JW808_03625 [Victivallales bacterium]|nr:hypothetical protein [Victivallales bacterium]